MQQQRMPQQFLEVYNVGITKRGLIKVNNLEEVWLNQFTNSVSIRYKSPNGNLVDHEECYSDYETALLRFIEISTALNGYASQARHYLFNRSIEQREEEIKREEAAIDHE